MLCPYASLSSAVDRFVNDSLRPYRQLTIQLSEQERSGTYYDRNAIAHHLIYLKNSAWDSVDTFPDSMKLEPTWSQLVQCIRLFATAINIHIQKLLKANQEMESEKYAQAEDLYEQEIQRALMSMTKILAALKKDLQ